MSTIVIVEKTVAIVAAFVVGFVAISQLRDELPLHGLDAQATKVLLSLLVVGCVVAFLGALGIHG
jgi:hypothetical protein